MSQFNKILAIASSDMHVSTALQRAEALAEKTGAQLHLAIFDHNTSLLRARFLDPMALKSAIRGYLQKRHNWLKKLSEEYANKGITASVSVHWGAPIYEEIVRFVLEHEPDLVIKDVHAEKKLSNLIFTPEDWSLLRHCPVELMFVNPHASSYPKRILAAVDPFHLHNKPHELNDRIVRCALSMAYQCDATLEVVHAYPNLMTNVPIGMEAVLASTEVFEETRKEHESQFRHFGEEHSIPSEKLRFLDGDPDVVLPHYVTENKTDLLVMGSVHRTGLDQIFIGSTAERILDRIGCDVLVMKPEGFQHDLEKELKRRKPKSDVPEPWTEFRRYSL